MSRRCWSHLSGLVRYRYCSSLRLSWSYTYFLSTADRSMSLMQCLMHWRSVKSSIIRWLSWTHCLPSVQHCSGYLHYLDSCWWTQCHLSLSHRSSRLSVRSRSWSRSRSSSRPGRSFSRKTLRKIHIGRFILRYLIPLPYRSVNFIHSPVHCS